MKSKSNKRLIFRGLSALGMLALVCQNSSAGDQTISTTVKFIEGSVNSLISLIQMGAYVAGTGFIVGGILKFKQHKDNPTQVTVGQPIALILVGAALLFIPTVMDIAGASLFEKGTAGYIKPGTQ